MVFAPRDSYQGDNLLEKWLKKAGIPRINELFEKAKEEHRLWIDAQFAIAYYH